MYQGRRYAVINKESLKGFFGSLLRKKTSGGKYILSKEYFPTFQIFFAY